MLRVTKLILVFTQLVYLSFLDITNQPASGVKFTFSILKKLISYLNIKYITSKSCKLLLSVQRTLIDNTDESDNTTTSKPEVENQTHSSVEAESTTTAPKLSPTTEHASSSEETAVSEDDSKSDEVTLKIFNIFHHKKLQNSIFSDSNTR